MQNQQNSDETVVAVLRRNTVGCNYFERGAGAMKPHRADFALACKLAFYTCGGYDQMRRIFLKSSLVREKTPEARAESDYLEITLRRAIAAQERIGAYWIPRSSNSKKGGPQGRPLSASTNSVRELRALKPELSTAEIGRQLGIAHGTVRQILSRQSRKATSVQAASLLPVIEGTCVTPPRTPATEEYPDYPALMSCPRSVRHLYPKPKRWKETAEPPKPEVGVIREGGTPGPLRQQADGPVALFRRRIRELWGWQGLLSFRGES